MDTCNANNNYYLKNNCKLITFIQNCRTKDNFSMFILSAIGIAYNGTYVHIPTSACMVHLWGPGLRFIKVT